MDYLVDNDDDEAKKEFLPIIVSQACEIEKLVELY